MTSVVRCKWCNAILTAVTYPEGVSVEVEQRCPDRGCRMWTKVVLGTPVVAGTR